MPGNVGNAVAAGVMPWNLCRAFAHAREYPVLGNEYANGESQRGRKADTSRKSWRLTIHLSPAELAQLRDFCEDRKGSVEAFYFYDVWDTIPKFAYDETGTALFGRYLVRFEGAWDQMCGLGRAAAQIALIELA